MDVFLRALSAASRAKAKAIMMNERWIEHGLLPVGLKLHCLKDGGEFDTLLESLGGRTHVLDRNSYRHDSASWCLVLPPVGSARYAILLLECIEQFIGIKIFGNPDIQIQVCSPGRLPNLLAGLLTIGFYLGSDILRGVDLDGLKTTFSNSGISPRGRRITIYDGQGGLDSEFEWWDVRKLLRRGEMVVRQKLPFAHERTDVLTCTSRVDIQNVNLIATLLVHQSQGWFWRKLGGHFIKEMTELLQEHELHGFLDISWLQIGTTQYKEDQNYLSAIQEMMIYGLSEANRITLRHGTGGLLYQMHFLLKKYRVELMQQSRALEQGGFT